MKIFADPCIPMKSAEYFIGILKEVIRDVQHDIRISLGPDSDLRAVQYLSTVQEKVRLFDSEYKIEKYLKDLGLYEEPKQITIRRGENDKEHNATLFPIQSQIRNFLQLPEVLDTILNNQQNILNNHRENEFESVIGGTMWQEVIEQYPNEM